MSSGYIVQSVKHSIVIPDVVLVESARTGCPLEYACVLLDKESSGGRNVYGRDVVKCGPSGGSVTEANYKIYKSNRATCGVQGVGPLQLTSPSLQDRADQLGGCWLPGPNVRAGLELFSSYLKKYSDQDAFSVWNTGRVGSSPYSVSAMSLLPYWWGVIEGVS